MSAAPSQLVEIYQQLSENFSSHPVISIVPAKGDPPDRYEISYNIQGLCKHTNGDIVETTGHVIELAIPFGFPHFPPSCKPKSDLFHPDFDPAAICLGDFWHQDCQLPELIIYLGQMINGEFYSRTNAFNEEACAWYADHADTFPMTQIAWREGISAPIADGIDEPAIDTLDENDLSTDFDFLAIEETTEQEDDSRQGSPSAVEDSPNLDRDLLNVLQKQKRIYTLRKRIKDVDTDALPEDLRSLFVNAEEIIGMAEDLSRESRIAEKQGNIRQAIAVLAKISEYVEDYPELEAHASRLRLKLADQDAAAAKVTSTVPGEESIGEDNDSFEATRKSRRKAQQVSKNAVTPIRRISKRHIGPFLGGVLALLVAACGYYYWMAKYRFASAESAYSGCIAFMEKAQFESAKQTCEEAQTACDGIRFIYQEQVRQLRLRIVETLQSERMMQGLKGMILIDSKYMAQKDAEAIESFRKLRKEGEEFYLQENWQPVIDRYTQILAMSEIAKVVPADVLAEVKTKHDIAMFRLAYDSALQTMKESKWQKARAELSKAEELLAILPESDRRQYEADLNASLVRSTFDNSREEGDLFFTNAEWQKAIAAYELALSTAEGMAFSTEVIEMIQRNMKRAELYDLIDQGIKAFGTGAWDEAIGDYRRAEELLANHQANLNVADAEKSIKKLSRIVLQALIFRDRQTAAGYLEKNELTAARHSYRQLIEHIDKSRFGDDKEFAEIKKELAATIQGLDEKIFIVEKSKYLESEYQVLFTANYPTAVKENLTKPVITYTKDIGDKAIFKMQCTDTGGGRPLTLVMYYAYNKKGGRWELHSE